MTTEAKREAIALKPCPFCGADEHLSVVSVGVLTGDMPDRPHRVVCHNISHDTVSGPVDYGHYAAIKAWNTRAIMALAEPQVSEDVPSIGVRALNLARCMAKAEFRSDLDRCIDEAKAIMSNGPFQLSALTAAPASEPQALSEERALSIMLPPGDADGEYLDGWVDGQQYLIDNAATETQKGSGE